MAEKVKFRYCPLFRETFAKHRAAVESKFQDFIKLKSQDPLAQFGSKDRHFSGEGNLSGYIHAGLTHDISIVYKRHSKNPTIIDLYAVVTHDELGTGQPPNMKSQKNIAKKMASQDLV